MVQSHGLCYIKRVCLLKYVSVVAEKVMEMEYLTGGVSSFLCVAVSVCLCVLTVRGSVGR